MLNFINNVKTFKLFCDLADNGTLSVIEGPPHFPFKIERVFIVRGKRGSVRGEHAHKTCSQFLTCSHGSISVECTDGLDVVNFILDSPDLGLLIPPGIWAKQIYLKQNSILTVLCDKIYDPLDYIRNYSDYKYYRNS